MQNLFKLLASSFGFTSAQGLTSTNVQDGIDEAYNKAAKLAANNTLTGTQNITNSTASTATNNGALVVAGGVGVGGKINTADLLVSTAKVNAYRSSDAVYASGVATSNTSTRIIYNTERKDTTNIYDNTTGVSTIASGQGGDYGLCADAVVNFNGTSSVATLYLLVYVNNTFYCPIDRAIVGSVSNLSLGAGGYKEINDLVAGDTVDVRIFVSHTSSTITLLGAEKCTFSLRKLA